METEHILVFTQCGKTIALLKEEKYPMLSKKKKKSEQTKMLCLKVGVNTSFPPGILVKKGIFLDLIEIVP